MRTSTMARSILGIAILAAAGCGGGKTVTVTASSSTPTSTASTATNNVSEHELHRKQFEQFLATMKPLRHQANKAVDATNRADNEAAYYCCDGWSEAGHVDQRAEKVEKQVADRLAAITPPAKLHQVYLRYVQSFRDDEELFQDYAHDYLHHQAFTGESGLTNANRLAVIAWREDLIAYAHAHDFPLPEWTTGIGR